ncbi:MULTISPECIES: hypothetical protein [Bradyrhizobium]|uniref:hypothetical protein n=1 Tax=Bradyrhizobium TaxID=374 RepID=UPI000AA3918D|nr:MULTISPECIES: hypothetical protein [Bradyrhizobium]
MAQPDSKVTKITRFEAFIGGAWQAFEGEVVRTKDVVSVNREVHSTDGTSFRVTNVFNVSHLEAYAFGSPLDVGVRGTKA